MAAPKMAAIHGGMRYYPEKRLLRVDLNLGDRRHAPMTIGTGRGITD